MATARFIGEPITVAWDRPPLLEKTPRCPDRFTWREELFEIVAVLEERRDYGRRGRMAANMQPEHAQRAQQRGSWGVGRFFFRVRTANGRVFELYYDRAPRDSDARKGAWFLRQEVLSGE
jgi:hypothetical protein